MSDNEYFKPAVAAVALALLFPLYWFFMFTSDFQDFETALRDDILSLTFSDLLFITIGILEIYLYLSLRKSIKEQLNSSMLNACLLLMCILVAGFHLTVLFDLIFAVIGSGLQEASKDWMISACIIIALVTISLYAVVASLFSILLIVKESSVILKGFGVLLLVACLLQLSVIFSIASAFFFPIALVILAIYFLKEPQVVEVV